MSEIIERVARAIDPDAYIAAGFEGGADGWRQAKAKARAAIEAMREATGAMCGVVGDDCAAWECFRADGSEWSPSDVWRAMIDAALSSERQPA